MRKVLIGMLMCVIVFNTIFCTSEAKSLFDNWFNKEKEDHSEEEILDLSDEKIGALSMMNYLTVLNKEINDSSNSKMFLDNTFSYIVNNINPPAVDKKSLKQIRSILETIETYQSISSKREHLKYIYEQNQAKALQNAMPNSLSVLHGVQSENPAKAMASIIYLAVDAKKSYDSYVSEVENSYLQAGWNLDETARKKLNKSRIDTFTYMVDMCTTYHLEGRYALNETAVIDFVNYENTDNVIRRIEFLEKNEVTYRAYGKYWLVLAESYFEHGDYDKCLKAIKTYEKMNINTFRKDHDYAKALSLAIAAAQEEYSGEEYVNEVLDYSQKIRENIEPKDWALRYLVAQTYIKVYSITGDKTKLTEAYELSKENVTNLVEVQDAQNQQYLTRLKNKEVKEEDSEEDKEWKIKYNEWLQWMKKEREIELPPVYQPLIVNCNLLFSLAEELSLDDEEIKEINDILHTGDKPLFLVDPLEKAYWYGKNYTVKKPKIKFDGKTITIPANYISKGTTINVTITNGKKDKKKYKDWKIDSVDRGENGKDVTKFKAIYSSTKILNQTYKNKAKIKIDIIPSEDRQDVLSYVFKVRKKKKLLFFDETTFEMEKKKK